MLGLRRTEWSEIGVFGGGGGEDRQEKGGLWGSAVLGKAPHEQVSEWVSLYALVNLKKEQKSSKVTTCTHGQILKKPYENILLENSE